MFVLLYNVYWLLGNCGTASWKGHNKSMKEEESSICMHIRSIAALPLKRKDMRSIADIPKLADVGYGSTDYEARDARDYA